MKKKTNLERGVQFYLKLHSVQCKLAKCFRADTRKKWEKSSSLSRVNFLFLPSFCTLNYKFYAIVTI